jgi:hypothetical protein
LIDEATEEVIIAPNKTGNRGRGGRASNRSVRGQGNYIDRNRLGPKPVVIGLKMRSRNLRSVFTDPFVFNRIFTRFLSCSRRDVFSVVRTVVPRKYQSANTSGQELDASSKGGEKNFDLK